MMTKGMRGLSIVETMIVVSILIILSAVVMNMYINYNKFFKRQGTSLDMSNAAMNVAARIRSAVLQADAVESSHSFSGTTHTSSSTALVLKLPAVSVADDVIPGIYDYVAFYASGTAAYQKTDAGSGSARTTGTTQIASNVASLTFTYDGAPASATYVEFDFRTAATTSGIASNGHITQRTYVRN